MTPALRIEDLHRSFGPTHIIRGIEMEVANGERHAVIGPNGAGKSTLIGQVSGSLQPDGGEVWLAGQRIDQLSEKALARLRRRAIGFVFQAFHLMDELTAVENVELPALLAGRSPRAARRRATELLERVGLTDRVKHLPSALSGGERQRLKLAISMAKSGAVYVLDEPTTGLHLADVDTLLRLLDQLVDAGNTVVVIEHHQAVMAHADWIIDLGPGAGHDGGTVVFEGPPADMIAAKKPTLTAKHLTAYVAR